MKKSHFLTFVAVFLSSSAVLLSAVKKVNPLGPRLKTENASRTHYNINYSFQQLNVEGPFHVELVNDMSGFDIIGDSSLLQYISVSTESNPHEDYGILSITAKHPGLIPDFRPDSINQGRIAERLESAHIKIRIGLPQLVSKKHKQQFLRFIRCYSVKSANNLKIGNTFLILSRINEVDLNLQAKDLEIMPEGSGSIRLSGSADRLMTSHIHGIKFDAGDFKVGELYVKSARKAQIEIDVTGLARLLSVEDSQLNLGQPKYVKVEQMKE